MCGINGFITAEGLDDAGIRIQKMNDSLRHRGPDAGSYHIYSNGRVAVGQRRLSIIDKKTRANQPMVSASGEWVIVFNGEIYNYQELRAKTTYPYKTTSDTEVILAYVEEFGLKRFLEDCNGMFAFCLYHIPGNYMILARDRLGIKPLYYTCSEDQFVFSSEIKGILSSGLVDVKFHEAAVDEYLANRYVRAPYTFFDRVFQLEPGYWMYIDCKDAGSSRKMRQYWKLPEEFNCERHYDENAILKSFEEKLITSVRRRLVADVPLGTYLSGGVDSSLITALTAKRLGHAVDTYTIGFPELNEFEYAELVADMYHTHHHRILMDYQDYFSNLKDVIAFKDAPLGVPNEVPLALMSRELKKKITVVLSGEGADELLGGYGRIYRAPFDFKNHIKGTQDFFDYFTELYEYVPRKIRDKYIVWDTKIRDEFDDKLREVFMAHGNEENVFRYFHSYHVQGLLQRVDTTTMLASVEARVPFLDHELVEFSYREIPYDLKLRWKDENSTKRAGKLFSSEYSEICDTPKYLLKKVSYKYLPKEVIERKKVGFPVPLNAWQQQIEQAARDILPNAPWLKSNKLDGLLKDCRVNMRAGQILWMLINLEFFRTAYFEKSWRY